MIEGTMVTYKFVNVFISHGMADSFVELREESILPPLLFILLEHFIPGSHGDMLDGLSTQCSVDHM